MKRWFTRTAERIDAFSLRERAMVFLAMAVFLVAVLDAVLLQPQLAHEKRMSGLLAQRQGELREVQAQMQKSALAREGDPDRDIRKRLDAAKVSLAGLDRKIAEEQRKFTTPDQMRAMLQEMLARNTRLRLVDLKTLPPSTIARARPQDVTAAKPRAALPAEQVIFRHGVEMTVNGAYLDLLAYLVELERLPSQTYWGSLELKVEEHPATMMKITVYTLSFDRAWLRV